MRRIAVCLLALAALGAGADCGGGDSGPPLSADEYAKQANAICKAGDAKLADQPQGIAQERRFEGCKQLFDRFGSGRLGAGWFWWHQGHGRRQGTIRPESSNHPGVWVASGHRVFT